MTARHILSGLLLLLAPAVVEAGSAALSWQDLSSDETGFIVSRRPACGSSIFTAITTTAANVTAYTDNSAPEPVAEYQVRATNATGDSAETNTACWGLWKHGGLGTPTNHGTRDAPPPHGLLP